MVIVAAFAAGLYWPRPGAASQEVLQANSLAEVRGELHQMREMLTLSLMQQQSATERLRGVSGSAQIDMPGNEIIRALLDTLMHDSNVNVRLACVDALRRFSRQDQVRQGTIQALHESAFPLVQIALIDYMVETKDKDAVDALRRLSEDSMANEAVRGRAVWGLQQLRS
jgi:HEAT repeat protein